MHLSQPSDPPCPSPRRTNEERIACRGRARDGEHTTVKPGGKSATDIDWPNIAIIWHVTCEIPKNIVQNVICPAILVPRTPTKVPKNTVLHVISLAIPCHARNHHAEACTKLRMECSATDTDWPNIAIVWHVTCEIPKKECHLSCYTNS